MFYQVYKLLTLILSVLLIPIFYAHPRGRLLLKQRLGFWGDIEGDVLWLHAASVGEVNSILPILPYLKERFPNLPILLTATTTTGLKRAEALVDYVRLLPFDNSFFIAKALRHINPKCFIFAETEIWPCLLTILKKQNCPIIMLNATISDFTWPIYKLAFKLLPKLLSKIDYICCADLQTQQRLITLGLSDQKVVYTGNLKYCQNIDVSLRDKARNDSQILFANKLPILVLGSLRPGEELFWLPTLKQYIHKVNVVIAPRHPEKMTYFTNALQHYSLAWQAASQQPSELVHQVLLVDSLGKLLYYYAMADLAFVGGSMIPKIGGHNPLEPAAFAVPVCIGVEHVKVKQLVQEMQATRACVLLSDAQSVAKIISRLVDESEELEAIGQRGQAIFIDKQKALKEVINQLDRLSLN